MREGGELRRSIVLVLFFNGKIFFTPACCSFSYSDALDLKGVTWLCGDARFSCCDCLLFSFFSRSVRQIMFPHREH
jgi:hypothetical protein